MNFYYDTKNSYDEEEMIHASDFWHDVNANACGSSWRDRPPRKPKRKKAKRRNERSDDVLH